MKILTRCMAASQGQKEAWLIETEWHLRPDVRIMLEVGH